MADPRIPQASPSSSFHFWGIQYSSDVNSSRSGSVDITASKYDALLDAELSFI
jgi:hypothetical protein